MKWKSDKVFGILMQDNEQNALMNFFNLLFNMAIIWFFSTRADSFERLEGLALSASFLYVWGQCTWVTPFARAEENLSKEFLYNFNLIIMFVPIVLLIPLIESPFSYQATARLICLVFFVLTVGTSFLSIFFLNKQK